MKSQIARLELLEARRRGDPLIILTADSDGIEAKTTVSEMLETGNLGFIRVLSGSSLSDLDLLLAAFHKRALEAVEGGVTE